MATGLDGSIKGEMASMEYVLLALVNAHSFLVRSSHHYEEGEMYMIVSHEQKERAEQFRRWHVEPPLLVLPNAWDVASARLFEQKGFRAVATTSSGVAAAYGYADGEHIPCELLCETVERITRVLSCPLTVDIEAGYGDSLDEILQTVQAIVQAGAVGINFEDSSKRLAVGLMDPQVQQERIRAIRELGRSLGLHLVINARVDTYVSGTMTGEERFEETVRRARLYYEAGADSVYPILMRDPGEIAHIVKDCPFPVNILASPGMPSLSALEAMGVARVSFGGELMKVALGSLAPVSEELIQQGTYEQMSLHMLPNEQFKKLPYPKDV